jgi:hypothetical protein
MKQEGKDDIYNIFLYLNKLICGIGKTSLKILLNDGEDESKINFIKNKLNGLINVEYYMEEEIFNANCVMIEKFSKSLKAWRKVGINPVRQVKALLGKDNSKIYDIMESLEDERQAERIMESMANNDPISRKDHDAVLIAIKEHKIKMGKKEWIVEK